MKAYDTECTASLNVRVALKYNNHMLLMWKGWCTRSNTENELMFNPTNASSI